MASWFQVLSPSEMEMNYPRNKIGKPPFENANIWLGAVGSSEKISFVSLWMGADGFGSNTFTSGINNISSESPSCAETWRYSFPDRCRHRGYREEVWHIGFTGVPKEKREGGQRNVWRNGDWKASRTNQRCCLGLNVPPTRFLCCNPQKWYEVGRPLGGAWSRTLLNGSGVF